MSERATLLAETNAFMEARSVSLPTDFTLDIPDAGWYWLLSAGVSTTTAHQHGIGWSERLQRVIIPVKDVHTTELVGLQARAVHNGHVPKYLNTSATGKELYICKCSVQPVHLNTLVVVEDSLSTIKVSGVQDACAVLGTTLHSNVFARLIDRYPNIILWLDGDKAGRVAAKKAYNKLTLQGFNVRNVFTEKDPKRYSKDFIREFLK